MAIMLKALKIVDGTPKFPGHVLFSWDNDHKFPFDISVPENWKRFIKKNKIPERWRSLAVRWIEEKQKPGENRPLPRSDDGLPVAFMVYTWGGVKGAKVSEFYMNLFPGAEEDPETGELKTRDLAKYAVVK